MESKVLLIDDDYMTNYLHKRVISNASLSSSIIVSTNGKEGIEELLKIEDAHFNNIKSKVIVFLDINMPVMDGWTFLEVFKEIKNKLNFEIKIFVLSSSINPDDKARAEKNSFVTKYINKPLNQESISYLKSYF
jgi:CheY-like chemotaxis protein